MVSSPMVPPDPPAAPSRRRPSPLKIAVVALGLLGVAVIVWGVAIRRPPRPEPPSFGPVALDLVPDARVTLPVDLEANLSYEVVLDFDVPPDLPPLGSIVQGGWQGHEGPPRLAVRCDVTAADGTTATAATGDRLVGTLGRTSHQIQVGWIRDLAGPAEVEVQVQEAAPELASRECRVLVLPGIERCGISITWSDLLLFAGFVLLVLAGLLFVGHLVCRLVRWDVELGSSRAEGGDPA